MERKIIKKEVEFLINLVLNDKVDVIYIYITNQWQFGLTFHIRDLGLKTKIITSKKIMKSNSRPIQCLMIKLKNKINLKDGSQSKKNNNEKI
jgi:hypothetical protein